MILANTLMIENTNFEPELNEMLSPPKNSFSSLVDLYYKTKLYSISSIIF